MCAANMAGTRRLRAPRRPARSASCRRRRRRWCLPLLACLVVALTVVKVAAAEAPRGARDSVQTLTDANWTLLLEGQWMVMFFAPWCPACQQVKADWEEFARQSTVLGVSVGKVDVTQQPGLSGRFLVTTLPTIFHAHDGSFRRYLSSRAAEDFQNYIIQKKWEAVEPVPAWKSPSSLIMTGMAGLFRLSVWIRQIHSYLTETVGVPVWGSYIIFALVTLFTGLLLGLMLVLIADCLCPSRPKHKTIKSEVYTKEDGSEDDVEDTLTEERQLSDAENESAKVSGEESAGEEGLASEGDVGAAQHHLPEDATESSVRQRKPQGPEAQET
ncbi:thioredoxin-related transmembrane protein 4 [Scleropages formosus]|uniref:Thioredoxin-related transmembrane protein 4 n=2 Tax=Scleropages formosus TaxID=113540 RepID=A0A8C9WSN9_SCLFO|nr:thioredoxin-related transmembrane protein 4 [Scleropages formosus]